MLGIDYPVYEIDGKKLVVRQSFAAQILMQRRGIDPGNLNDFVGPGKPQSAENWVKIFGCMVAENFTDPTRPDVDLNTAPSTDYWLMRIDPYEMGAITDVCNSAFLKAAEARRTKLAIVLPNQGQAS